MASKTRRDAAPSGCVEIFVSNAVACSDVSAFHGLPCAARAPGTICSLSSAEVRHLSSFGELRIGVGQGTLNDQGDLELKVSFEGEAPGTYRLYHYTWVNENEYDMKSVRYDDKGKPTGLFRIAGTSGAARSAP